MGTVDQDLSFGMQHCTPANSVAAGPLAQEALARKAEELTTPEFIESRILPLVRMNPSARRGNYKSSVIQNAGTGRLTLRYNLGPERVYFAKVFSDDLGARSYEVNRCLWEAGFNLHGHYRVPQPIGFLPDHNLYLMSCVRGIPLGAIFHGDASVDLVAGSREAAKWLIGLHRCSLRNGLAESDWDSLKLFRMASRLFKAVAVRPDKLDAVRELLEALEERIGQLPSDQRFVFTHGRYHHDHVFLDSEATTVIDLDRCRPSDPAKDAAEFVRVLRMTAFKEGFDMAVAEQATSAFLNTYLAEVPETAASLGCYWAVFVFHTLLGGLKKGRSKGKRTWEELMTFYFGEIKRALEFAQ